jgi:hypothetical protein
MEVCLSSSPRAHGRTIGIAKSLMASRQGLRRYAPERARATLHRILEPELPDVVVVLRTDFRPAPEPKATIDL